MSKIKITSFFTTREEVEDGDEQPQPKRRAPSSSAQSELVGVHKKRNQINGFNSTTVTEQVKLMKRNSESGKWREFNKMSLPHTIITRKWTYEGKGYL